MNLILKKNQPPGSVIYTGVHQVPTEIKHYIYNESKAEASESMEVSLEHANFYIVKGLKDTEKITSFCEGFKVDPMVLEDIFNVNQRNKIELHENYIFCVLKYSYLNNGSIEHDYLSLLLFLDKVIVFHEHNTSLSNEVFQRIKNNRGLIRRLKHDYLFYVIFDTIIDHMILVEKELSVQTLDLEEEIISSENVNQNKLYQLRKELLLLKSQIEPLHESFIQKEYMKSNLIKAEIYKYLEDLTDHVRRINIEISNERELLRNLVDVHMNNVSNRMNSIMKTLTIFSAIFIPLSFLVGFFGMNFTNFSILSVPHAVLIFTLFCVLLVVFMIIYFKKRKWF